MSDQAFHFLTAITPFSFLPEEEVRKIADSVSQARYKKGRVLFVQGESRVEAVHILLQGAAERYYEKDKERILRGVMDRGDIYGGISVLLNNGISLRTVQATEESLFYTLSEDYFLDICQRHQVFTDYFSDTFGKRMLDKTYASVITKIMQPEEDALQFFNQPITKIYNRDLLSCPQDLSIQEAAARMSQNGCSSIFVTDARGRYLGVVTDNDLRRKVIATGHDITKPVSDIMSAPLRSIPHKTLIFEGLMSMIQQDVKHLAVTDDSGGVLGVLSNRDMLTAQASSPFFLIREIKGARRHEELMDKHGQLPPMIKSLIHSGAKAENITQLITAISDAILDKLIGFALEKLGPPPTEFVFMIMGSEGRKEQTLKTDQDNAIIYKDPPTAKTDAYHQYFLKLGETVCNWLDRAGYAFCEGGIMAKNPRLCQPLATWKEYFSSWIYSAEPEALLHSSIFFDFRGVYGDLSLTEELHRFLFGSLQGWSGFFRHLTENALHFKPPLGFFRNFVVESKGKHKDKFDIKSAMQPVVDFARIHALHNGIRESNTLGRLRQLEIKKVLTHADYNEISQAYSFLMHLRFVRQVTAITDEKQKPDNYINPRKLSNIEQTMLKEIFKRIEKFQNKLEFQFTGLT